MEYLNFMSKAVFFMTPSNASSSPDRMIDAISRFLNSPPDGTPAEIIEAFAAIGDRDFLPPRLFLETVKQAPIAISITDSRARILYVNKAFEKLTGYASEEILGKNESVLSSRSTPIEVYESLWGAITSSQVWKGMLVNHRKNKSEYLAELTISPVLDGEGQIAYFLGMHRDITEVHQLEQRLNFQKRLTEAALDAAPMVVAMMDADGKVIMDNHAYKALMGDFRGVEPASLFLKALNQQIGLGIESGCTTGDGFTNVDVRLDPPGDTEPRWFSCSGARIEETHDSAQHFFLTPTRSRCHLLLIANEVTGSRRRINEARLNMIRANMTEQQMVQTMREAISGAIYKLQVPLNVIRASLAIPSAGQCDSLQFSLKHALQTGEEAMDSLHDALPDPAIEDTSRLNINEILHEILKLSTDRLLASGIVVDWRPTAVLPSMEGRANALRGLFKYLLDNAIQAVSESAQSYRELRLQTSMEDDELVIEVIDNGPGVSEAHRLKIFEPFYCGWEQSRGHAGMGLTMAQEVAIGHGGSIEIDPDFYGGCRVFVRLPAHRDS
jgi:nitrogen fixation negative regulator NifL